MKKEIECLNGKKYTFSAIGANPKSIDLITRMQDKETSISVLLEAIEASLAVEYGKDKAKEIIDNGDIPFPKGEFAKIITEVIFA